MVSFQQKFQKRMAAWRAIRNASNDIPIFTEHARLMIELILELQRSRNDEVVC